MDLLDFGFKKNKNIINFKNDLKIRLDNIYNKPYQMNINDFNNLRCIPLKKGKKYPQLSWKLEVNSKKFKEIKTDNNYGILCGNYCYDQRRKKRFQHNNNITILDIDFLKPKNKTEEEHIFNKTFGADLIKTFDTYTIRTGGGGIHFYFKYVDDNILTSKINDKLHIDLLNSDKYAVGFNSIFEGNEYKIINDVKIKEMPKNLIEWLQNNLYDQNDKKNIIAKNVKNIKKRTINQCNEFEYLLSDDCIYYDILLKLPKKYLNERLKWTMATQFMKVLNKFDLWDKWSKQSKKYNKNNNIEIWNSLNNINDNNKGFNHIIKTARKKTIIPYVKYKNFQENTIKPDKIIHSGNKKYVKKYGNKKGKLGYDFFFRKEYREYNFRGDNIVVKSDTGSGKTTSFKHYIKNYFNEYGRKPKFISIVSRVSLGKEQYTQFNDYGVKCKFYEYEDEFLNGDNVIIQLDSLTRLYHIIKNIKDYVVFMDEYNSILDHLITSDTLKKNNKKYKIFQIFIKILREAKQVIMTDADISDACLLFLKDIGVDFIYVKNIFKHNKGIKTRELKNFKHLINCLKKQAKFLCCCDSYNEAKKIEAELLKINPDDEILIITKDTTKHFNLDEHNKIIFNPKIIYGIDSTMERPVYAYYKEHTISPPQFVQQITRCRNITQVNYVFLKKKVKAPLYKNIEQCETLIKQQQEKSIQELELLTTEEDANIYLKSLIRITYKLDCYNTNKFCWFLKIMYKRGFIIGNNYFSDMKSKDDILHEKDLLKTIKANAFDNFDPTTEQNKRINEYLQIPKEILEQKDDFIVNLFIDPYELNKHWNTCNLFFKDDKTIEYELKDKENFNIDVFNTSLYKIYYLNRLKELAKCDANFNATEVLDVNTSIKMIDEYKKIFRDRCKKLPNFTNIYDIKKYISKIIKTILPSNIYEMKRQKITINKKQIYYNEITIKGDGIEQHKELYHYRNPVIPDDDYAFIDDSEVDSEGED